MWGFHSVIFFSAGWQVASRKNRILQAGINIFSSWWLANMFRTVTEVSQEQFEKHFPIPLTHNSCLSSPEGQQLSTRQLKQGACINKTTLNLLTF
jgi:hypothetical protein